MKTAKHIHLVYLMHHSPTFNRLVIDEVSNTGKADHLAIQHKEDMSIDKEDINANVDLLLELNKLPRDFHQALRLALTSLSDSTTLKPRDRITPNLVVNLGIVSNKSTTANAASSEDSLKVGI